MNHWEILGINPTTDEEEIRKAYMIQLGQHHPEDDPEGFARLRAAYEKILRELENEEKIEETEEIKDDDTPTGRWIQKVEACYNDFDSRISESAWKELLEDAVCYQLDEAELASQKLLSFLMNHYRLPRKIWQLMNQKFSWEENKGELYRAFPNNFIHFVRNSIENEAALKYEQLEIGLAVEAQEIDEWIGKYFTLEEYCNTDQYEKIDAILEEMKAYDIYYSRVEAIEIYSLAQSGLLDEAVGRAKQFIKEHGACKETYYMIGKVFLKAGQDEDGLHLMNQCIQENTYHYHAHIQILKYYLVHPEQIVKAEESVKILGQYYAENEEVQGPLKQAYPLLIKYYEALDLQDEEIQLKRATYYNEMEENEKCEAVCNQIIKQNEKCEEAYKFLIRIANQKQDYKKAIDYITYWINGLDENQTQQKSIAYEQRGGFYHKIGDYEKAIEDLDYALKLNQNNGYPMVIKLECLEKLERYEALKNLARTIISKDETYYGLGMYYLIKADYLLENHLEAIDTIKESLRINPYVLEIYQIQAEIYDDLGQYEAVLSVVDTAKQYGFEQDRELTYYEAEALMWCEEYEKAEEVCEEAIRQFKEDERFYYTYARVEKALGNVHKALELITESIRLKPKSHKFYLCGDIYSDIKDLSKAIENYKKALYYAEEENYSNEYKADILDALGNTYLRNSQAKETVEAFHKAIEYNSKHKEVYRDLGIYYETIRDYMKAVECYSKQLEVEINDYNYTVRGLGYLKAKEYEKARADFELAIQYNPNNGYGYYGIASIYKMKQDDESAQRYYEKAIEVYEKCELAYQDLGELLIGKGLFVEAMQLYQKAIMYCPNAPQLYVGLGVVHRELAEYELALDAFTKAEQLDSTNHDIYYHRGILYNKIQQYDQAITYYNKAISIYKNHAGAYCKLGEAYTAMGDYELAEKSYKKSIEIDNQNVEVYVKLADTYFAMNQMFNANNMYEQALKIVPEYKDALYGKACCHKADKEYKTAIKWFERMLEYNPKEPKGYLEISNCYAYLGKLVEAKMYLEKGIEACGSNTMYLIALGNLYFKLGEDEKAIEYLNKVIALEPNEAEAYDSLGRICRETGDYEKAYAYCIKAIEVSKGKTKYIRHVANITMGYLYNYEATLRLLKEVYEREELEDEMCQYIGMILVAMHQQDEAHAYLKKAIDFLTKKEIKNQANACTYYHLGECYFWMYDLENAKKYCLKAQKHSIRCKECITIQCHESHAQMGKIYEVEEDYKKALKEYERANLISESKEYQAWILRIQQKINERPKKTTVLGGLLTRIMKR